MDTLWTILGEIDLVDLSGKLQSIFYSYYILGRWINDSKRYYNKNRDVNLYRDVFLFFIAKDIQWRNTPVLN